MHRRRDLVRREPTRGLTLPSWIERLVSVGIVSTDPDVVRRQRCTNVGIFAAVANSLSHLIINAAYDFRGLLLLHVYNAAMTILPLFIPRLHRYGENVGIITLSLLILVPHMFVVWAMGTASNLHVYYTLGGAMLFGLGVQHWRVFLVFFALWLGALLFAMEFAPIDGFILPQERPLRELLATHAMVNTITIIAVVLFYALTALRRAELDLQTEYDRSEALVEAVMPRPIAERIKAGDERIADRIGTLTVMFTDLVDFTGAVHEMPPEEVVDYLDRLVRVFDGLCEQHGVEKIKTIGDAYMAAAGFDGPPKAGAVAVGRLALALLAAIGEQPALGGRRLQMRIGIHSGPATAGVIGDTRFSYDIWGDAVNTASRMESSGEPGCIHVSADFRALAAGWFDFEERGTTALKGIGEMRTFFLLRERSADSASGGGSGEQRAASAD